MGAGRLDVMDTTTADPLIGQLLDGRYRIDTRVARGGMATVYTGFDTRLDRVVAIKVMHSALAEDDEFVERFRREAKSAARLSHPNVVGIYDQGEDAGRVYLVMEYVDGQTLRALLRERGRLTPGEALSVLEGLLAALAAAHAAGIVHRDVKPENILIDEAGHIDVADFGLARAIEATSHTVADGRLIGTVAYLAPEQVESGAADARTDIYAAGVVLFEALTGGPPYTGDTPLAVAYRHVNEDVPAPSAVLPGLPPSLDDLVLRATRRDPDERPQDATGFLADVRRARAELGPSADTSVITLDDAPTLITTLPRKAAAKTADAKPGADTPAPPRRRRRSLIVALVMGLILGTAGVVGWYLGSGRYVDTPAFVNVNRQEALALAGQYGLDVEFGDTVFSETVKADMVAEQSPDVGDRVRRGGTVTLHLSKGPERLAVPNVLKKSRAQATDAITAAGLKVGQVKEAFSFDVAKGAVISTDPKAGTTLKRDTAVGLVVSKGPEQTKVPQVVGRNRADAEQLLTTAGLTPKVTEVFHDEKPVGEVIAQSVEAGKQVAKRTTVEITVSKGPELVEVPNVEGRRQTDARRILENAGFVAEFRNFPGRQGRTVIDQDPNPGEMARPGSTVICYMF